jgi:hypothetical protein
MRAPTVSAREDACTQRALGTRKPFVCMQYLARVGGRAMCLMMSFPAFDVCLVRPSSGASGIPAPRPAIRSFGRLRLLGRRNACRRLLLIERVGLGRQIATCVHASRDAWVRSWEGGLRACCPLRRGVVD